MEIDHFAYLARDTDKFIESLPQRNAEVTLYREPLESQQAYISFVKTDAAAPLIEVVEPYADNEVMNRRLDREGTESFLYHIGYNVTDFDASFKEMRKQGWLPLTMPFEGMTPGCRASHLFNPNIGMVEIMEVAAQ